MLVGKKSSRRSSAAPPIPENCGAPDPSILLDYIDRRDFTGALTVIDFCLNDLNQPATPELLAWRAYSLFHMFEYSDAADIYLQLSKETEDTLPLLCAACCFFLDGDIERARELASKCPDSPLRGRLMLRLEESTGSLELCAENIIAEAAKMYSEGDVAGALNKLQCILTYGVNYATVYVFMAMCQFRLGELSQADESLAAYLAVESDSGLALNLKACIMAEMLGREMAEAQLLQIGKFGSEVYGFMDAMIKNNMVVFSGGENGFDVLPSLVQVLPEARINLQILYARKGMFDEVRKIMSEDKCYETEQALIQAAALYQQDGMVDVAVELLEAATPPGIDDMLPNQRLCQANASLMNGEYDTALILLTAVDGWLGTALAGGASFAVLWTAMATISPIFITKQ